MKKRKGVKGFKDIELWLQGETLKHNTLQPLAAAGLVQLACKDCTDIPAWSICEHHGLERDYISYVNAPMNLNEKQFVGDSR
jgi:hypothetical protein